jgi:hypothetical protein
MPFGYQARPCHLLESFGNDWSLFEFIAKYFKPGTTWTDEKSGIKDITAGKDETVENWSAL